MPDHLCLIGLTLHHGNNVFDCILEVKRNILKSIDEGPFQMGIFRETLAEGTEGAFHLGSWFKMFRVNRIEDRGTIHGVEVQLGIGEHKTELGMLIQVKQDRLSATTATNGVALDEEQLLFLAGGQDNAIDEDVDEQPVQDLSLNVDNVFQADEYPVYDEAGLSYDSDILSEYVKDNAVPGVQIADNSLTAKLATYKEQVELYERRARFELTEREQKIDEQLRIVITDRNIKEETLKKELHSVKLQLASTINHNKSMVEEVTSLKKDFKQKENKYLEEFLDMKSFKEKPALYNGHEIIKNNHVPSIVHNTEDTIEIAETTRRKMNDKIKDPKCVNYKVKIAPHDYSKENFLVTFTPQKQLTPEQIFWSQDLIKMKAEALKEQTTASRPIKALTMYPPNIPVTLVSRVLPTKSQVKINIFTLIQLFLEFDKTCKKRITPIGLTEGERGFEQTKECYLKEKVFYVAMNSELNVSRFTKMHVAHTIVEACCLELEAELSNLRDKIHNDNHNELVNRFSNLEVHHLNLQLKYQNLKDSFGNNPPTPAKDTLDFNSVFAIGKMQASLQGKDNVIKKVKTQISHLQETRCEAGRTFDFRALDFQITQLNEKVTVLQEQNDLFKAKNEKIKQHYKESYDSIKITRVKNIEQTTALTTENVNLKAQILNNVNIVIKDHVKPTVLAPGKYAIDVEPIPPRNRNNREVHLDYLRHLKESVETLREIVEEAKVKTNVHVPPSTGVNHCIGASGSQPRSNTKKNKISSAKGVNKMKVEEHPRTNKSHLRTTNRVDSSSRSKRTKINSNSDYVCQTCNKYLIYANHGCSKHITGDRSWLMNFVKKFIGTVRFRNDHFGAIMGYGDYAIGDSVISRVCYVEGLGHNLFFIRQFCDSDLEVAFRKHSCYVRDTDGVELIKGSRGSNLYTISVEDMMKSSPIYLLSKASKNKSWLWHRRLNHLNFDTINDLARKDLVRGLPRLKFKKDRRCSACQLGKSKKHTHKPKTENTNLEVLNTLHVDLCGPMRMTPQQNDVVKKRNRTLVEAARIMLIFSKASMFLWAEAVATTCYTKNRSLIHTRHNKTPYELVHNKKPDLTFFRVFGALCYPTNNNEDLGKLQPTAKIGIFIGYAPSRKGPALIFLTPGQISSGLVPNLSFTVIFGITISKSTSRHQGVATESTLIEDNPVAPVDNNPFINVFAPEPTSDASSSGDVSSAESTYVSQTLHHL
nr:integrase, catalytic region, zinc finger, CCHC-type, peptidase aspartic, catalytic [Tanacetum cinerariifolium]